MKQRYWSLVGIGALACCDGHSNGDGADDGPVGAAPMYSGRFIDASVCGISYRTATLSGVTDCAGHFKYRSGESVTFSVGGDDLPESQQLVPGSGISEPNNELGYDTYIVSPFSLSSDPTTQTNIASVLQMSDDGTVPGAIVIPAAVEEAKLPPFDFSSVLSNAQPLADAISAIENTTHTLPDPIFATNRAAAAVRCAQSGDYSGSYTTAYNYTRDDGTIETMTGNFYFLLMPTGNVSGLWSFGVSDIAGLPGDYALAGSISAQVPSMSAAIPLAQQPPLAKPIATLSIEGNGQVIGSLKGMYSGYRTNSSTLTTFDVSSTLLTGQRLGIPSDPIYRFVTSGIPVTYQHTNGVPTTGILALVIDIGTGNEVTVHVDDYVNPASVQESDIAGNLAGNTINATGNYFIVTGPFDQSGPTYSGRLSDWKGNVIADFSASPLVGCAT